MQDTICAIATAVGSGAISIIRVSGNDAILIVNKIFKGKDLTKVESHTIHYGKIMDGNKEIDEVLVSIMKAPKTYTMEDVVEINTHGGIAPTNKVLELLLKNGCRLAEAGEFTKRAYLNGRIDLTQAEAVMDKINAKTDMQNELATNSLNGKVSNLINNLRENDIMVPKIINLKKRIEEILKESKNGKIIKEGIKTAIIGSPNVGKSSLLNELLQEDKAIVTDIAGTTRDIVEGQISINGILLNIIDTAGIRNTDDKVEAIGVEKSIKVMNDADLVLFMLNNNEELSNDNKKLLNELNNRNYIIIVNKIDLVKKIDISKLNKDNIIEMSIKEKKGINELKNKIIELFNLDNIETKDPTYISNVRSIGILELCLNKVKDIEDGLNNNYPIDMLELDIKAIWEELGKINGTTYEEELLDEMFKRFCLGK